MIASIQASTSVRLERANEQLRLYWHRAVEAADQVPLAENKVDPTMSSRRTIIVHREHRITAAIATGQNWL